MGAYEDFVNLELPRRSALLTYEITSYDGNPNDDGAPAILQGAPKGTWFLEATEERYWRKYSSDATSWMIADSSYDQTTSAMDIYVRAVDGDDSNPGTEDDPLADFPAAEALIPYHVNHTVIIHVGLHAGSGYTMPSFRQRVLNANIWVIGDGGGAVGEDGFTEIVAETAAGAGSDDRLVVSSGLSDTEFAGFGEHFGRTIEITSGAANGDRRTIHHNTTTGYIPDLPFTAAVAEGDTYRMLEPETIINFEANEATIDGLHGRESDLYLNVVGKKINFVNFKFNSSETQYYIALHNQNIGFYGVMMTSSDVIINGNNASVFSGMENANNLIYTCPSSVADLGVGNSTMWTGWGLSHRSVVSTDGNQFLNVAFYGVLNSRSVSFSSHSFSNLFGGSFWGNYACVTGYFAKLYVIASMPIWFGSDLTANVGILVNYNSIMDAYSVEAGSIYVRGLRGLRSRHHSHVFIENLVSGGWVFENTTVGFQTELVGTIHVPSSMPLPTMNCGGNDFSADYGGTIHTIDKLVPNAYFKSLSDGFIGRY